MSVWTLNNFSLNKSPKPSQQAYSTPSPPQPLTPLPPPKSNAQNLSRLFQRGFPNWNVGVKKWYCRLQERWKRWGCLTRQGFANLEKTKYQKWSLRNQDIKGDPTKYQWSRRGKAVIPAEVTLLQTDREYKTQSGWKLTKLWEFWQKIILTPIIIIVIYIYIYNSSRSVWR